MYDIISEQWCEKYAWLPVRSTWSRKIIWFKKYHSYEYKFLRTNKVCKNRFIYTSKEYIMMILNNRYEE